MKTEKTFKIITLLSYCVIILMGNMIGIPLLFWLIWTSIDFGNINQLFAVLGLVGIILLFTNWHTKRAVKILSFIFMLSPVVFRLSEVPLEKFDYPSFQIPLYIFSASSIILILKPNVFK